jgi:hypothetical protein
LNYENSVVAVTGLDGHAYGSWRGRGDLAEMWLRDFFSEDFPDCRTMIYGYNSKLNHHSFHTIQDYVQDLLLALKLARKTAEVYSLNLDFLALYTFLGRRQRFTVSRRGKGPLCLSLIASGA